MRALLAAFAVPALISAQAKPPEAGGSIVEGIGELGQAIVEAC